MDSSPSPTTPTGGETLRVVLLVAHGSRNPASAPEHERLCGEVQAAVAGDTGAATTSVRPAYLEITEPGIGTAIDAAIDDGAATVRVLPHFLSPGNHVLVDIPAIVSEARDRHPTATIELVEHLGADPALVGLLATRALD